MRSARLLQIFAACALCAASSTAQAPTAERSTGQVETAVEPAPPPPPTRLALPADKPALIQDGKVSAAATAHFVLTTPAGRMIEIRINSSDSAAAMSVFRGDRAEAEPGTARAEGAVGWISGTEQGGDLRIVVWTTTRAESPFKLLVRVHPPEPAEGSGSAEK